MGSVWNYPHVPIGSVVFGGARFAEFRTILYPGELCLELVFPHSEIKGAFFAVLLQVQSASFQRTLVSSERRCGR